MKKLTAVFVLLFVVLLTASVSAQELQFPSVDEIHVFAGMNIPTRNVEKSKFEFDYMRLQVDLSNDEMKIQFRHDFASNNLQLANVSKSFGDFTFTVGRFLDPVWQLGPAPHLMSQTAYPVSVNTFTVLENGLGLSYVALDITGKQIMKIYASVFDKDGSRNISASIDALGIVGAFIQTCKTETGFGVVLRGSLNSLVNLEGGMVKRPERMENTLSELYIQNQMKLGNEISIWLQGDFQWNTSYINDDESIVPANLKASRVLMGGSYQYSKGSHVKLFYNFTDKVAIAKITFFL